MPACEAAGQQRFNALQPDSATACISTGANTPNNVVDVSLHTKHGESTTIVYDHRWQCAASAQRKMSSKRR